MNTITLQLTLQQAQNLLSFLNRVQLNGNEAEELVRLKMILVQEGQKLQAEEQMSKKVVVKDSKSPQKEG